MKGRTVEADDENTVVGGQGSGAGRTILDEIDSASLGMKLGWIVPATIYVFPG